VSLFVEAVAACGVGFSIDFLARRLRSRRKSCLAIGFERAGIAQPANFLHGAAATRRTFDESLVAIGRRGHGVPAALLSQSSEAERAPALAWCRTAWYTHSSFRFPPSAGEAGMATVELKDFSW